MQTSKVWFWALLNIMMVIIIIGTIFFILPGLSSWQRSFVPARTLSISAQGMTTATPDMAEISFSVVSQGTSPQTLSDTNNSKMSAVLQFVSSQQIATSDIATTGYDLEPNYQYDHATSRNFITGYTLTQTVEVKIRDLSKVASVLGGLAPLGVNQIGGVNFTFQDPNKFVDLARADALSKAATQARMMASESGASLGEVISVNESSNVPTPFPMYRTVNSVAGVMDAAPVTPTLSAGTQDVTDNVTVIYELK